MEIKNVRLLKKLKMAHVVIEIPPRSPFELKCTLKIAPSDSN